MLLLEELVIHFDEMSNQFFEFCVTHKFLKRKKFLPIFIFPEDKDNVNSIEPPPPKKKSELRTN